MIGRDQSRTGVTRNVFAIDVVENQIAAAEIDDLPLVRTFAEGIAQRAGASDDRCDVGRWRSRILR
jgi:hypothetical protein